MLGYVFIEDLFKAILGKSRAINGRFAITPKFGHEINSDLLGQILDEAKSVFAGQKYPLSILMPPTYSITGGVDDGWKMFYFRQFFLKTTFYDSQNQISDPNQFTRTSQHSLVEDWHDMARAAENFLRALKHIQKRMLLHNTSFRFNTNVNPVITPVSYIGVDRASGVRLDFQASLFVGCDIEDYSLTDLNSLTVVPVDAHPEHKL